MLGSRATVVSLLLLFSPPVAAQGDALRDLETEATKQRGAFNFAGEAETLRKGVALIEAREGRDAAALVPWLIKLGQSLQTPKDLSEAQAALERAIRIIEKTKGPEDRAILDAVGILILRYGWDGKPANVQALYKRAIAIAAKAYGPDSSQVQTYYVGLAHSYRNVRNFDAAEDAYQHALAISRKNSQGRYDPWLTMWLAMNRIDRGRYAEAEPLVLEALRHWQTDKFRREALGRNHEMRQLWSLKGKIEENLGRPAEAVQSYEEALRLAEEGQAAFYYTALLDTAGIYLKVDRYDGAEKQYRHALAIAERMAGPNSFDAARVQFGLGRALSGQRRWPEAEAAFKRSLAIYERLFGASDDALRSILEELQRVYRSSGRDAEAARVAARIRTLKPVKR